MIDYYQTQKESVRRKKKKKRTAIIIGIAAVLIAGGLIWLFHSRYARLASVEINSGGSGIGSQIEEFVNTGLDSQSFFERMVFGSGSIMSAFIRQGEIIRSIEAEFPAIRIATSSVDLFTRRLNIDVIPRERFGLWCSNSGITAQTIASTTTVATTTDEVNTSPQCFWFDRDGTAFAQGPSTEGQLINKIVDRSGNGVRIGDKMLSPAYAANLSSIFDFIGRSGIGQKTLYFKNWDEDELTTDPNIAPVITFSFRNNPQYALKSVRDLLSGNLLPRFIDLTVPYRVYYE